MEKLPLMASRSVKSALGDFERAVTELSKLNNEIAYKELSRTHFNGIDTPSML